MWLEIRTCTRGGQAVGADGKMLEISAISEVLEAAARANKQPAMWDYSRRLAMDEIEAIRSTVKFTKSAENSRSISHSANVAYKGSCYTLTLFAIKRSQ